MGYARITRYGDTSSKAKPMQDVKKLDKTGLGMLVQPNNLVDAIPSMETFRPWSSHCANLNDFGYSHMSLNVNTAGEICTMGTDDCRCIFVRQLGGDCGPKQGENCSFRCFTIHSHISKLFSDGDNKERNPRLGRKQIEAKMALQLETIDKGCCERVMRVWKEMLSTTLRDKDTDFRSLEEYVEFRIVDTGAP